MLKYILISFLIITNAYAYTCEEMGYTQTIEDCPDHGLRCPAEPEKMFCCDRCGSAGGYMYNEENCSPDDGLQLAGVQCGGKWTKCEQCTSEYKYNKDNCRAPKILAGVQCGNAYTQCVYPVGSGCVPTVGYIYYADGSCHADYDDTKEPIGIIVDAARKTLVAIDGDTGLPWNDGTTNYHKVTGLASFCSNGRELLDMDGESNTDIIVAFAKEIGQEHKAAEYCAGKTEGNKKWYLPAMWEMNILYNNITAVQNTLSELHMATSIVLGYHWSSTECDAGRLSYINMKDGKINTYSHKNALYRVRCFAHF